jgi:hypothetical protein
MRQPARKADRETSPDALVSRRPWFAAFLLATVATPAGVVFAWLAPRPLDAVVALPLVLVDMWAASSGLMGPAKTASEEAPTLRLLLLLLGIGLTWLLYVLVARFVFWRLSLRTGNGIESD